jgi:hypothetical protein
VGSAVQQIPQTEFLVPRSHTPQGRSPGPEDQSQTLRRRLPASGRTSMRGLPERGGSPIDWLRSDLAQRLTDPHPSPQLATASKALCRSYLSRLQTDNHCPPFRARPRSLPKRAHPARQAHQPLGPGTASRPQAGFYERARLQRSGGVDARPLGPAVPAPVQAFHRHSRLGRPTLTAHKPSRPTTTSARQQLRSKANPTRMRGQRPTQPAIEARTFGHRKPPSPQAPR